MDRFFAARFGGGVRTGVDRAPFPPSNNAIIWRPLIVVVEREPNREEKTNMRIVNFRRIVLGSSSVVLALALHTACSSDENADGPSGSGGSTSTGGASTVDGSSGGSTSGGSTSGGSGGLAADSGTGNFGFGGNVSVTDAGTVMCGDVLCQCNDGMDNDENGLIDGADPECTGPFDNDESSFATGISGDNKDPKWQDCFFDGNSGAGDDQCRYHTECITGERMTTDPSCTVSDDCLEFCGARTPNGCDCFGCCTITTEGGDTVNVMIADTCDLDNIDDTEACPRCTPDKECVNDCDTCELCPGKTAEDLPEECTPDTGEGGSGGAPPTHTCDGGQTVCESSTECQAGYYCSQGCCLPYIIR